MLDIVLVQPKIRLLIVTVKRILKTKTLIRHIFENIAYFRRNIKTFGVDFGTPKISCFFICIRIKVEFTSLLFVIHIPEIDETHQAFFGIIILIAIQNIDLFCQWIVEKAIIIHIVFGRSCITVNKQCA